MKRLLIALLLILSLSACGSKNSGAPPMVESLGVREADYMVQESPPAPAAAGANVNASMDAVERMVIRNASLTLVVSDPGQSLDAVNALADSFGGYVVSSNLYSTTSENGRRVPVADVTFRVPAEHLDEALHSLKDMSLEVRAENISGQDITADYIDLQAQLNSLQAAESQLETMMQDATDMQDVIDIFNQLTYYRQQIEQVKGQMQYYEQAVALSAVSVTFLAEEGVLPLDLGGWGLDRTFHAAFQDLIYFLQGFVDFLIRFILLYLPAGLLLLMPAFIIIRLLIWAWRVIRGRAALADLFAAETWRFRRPQPESDDEKASDADSEA